MNRLIASITAFFIGLFFRGATPAFGPIPEITPVITSVNTTGLPLTLPGGFSISVFAKNVPDARVLVFDPSGRLLVSSPATGKVFSVSQNGIVSDVISGLNKPHGLAFKDGKLYIAETDGVAVYDYNGTATNRKKIVDLPGGGNHFSRTIGFGPDGKLYIAVGSTCNVCKEANPLRASIQVYDKTLVPYATGLRNAVFFIWKNGEMWATDMGRDLLGDDIPPDTINIITQGKNYGWPYCYGKRIPDKTFGGTESYCKTTEPSFIDYQAHSAPLGLVFYKNDLLVAMHGSWNRTAPTGYKIVRFKFDDSGKYLGNEDFISGWLTSSGALGRPVDIISDDRENLYISDDKAGVVYKVTKN